MTPTYSFLPWLRSGVANSITSADHDPSVLVRAKLALDLTIAGAKPGGGQITQVIPQQVSLYGPGDVMGLDPKAIIKVEPRQWITNFEPNLLPYIEFYDEDFPWRYSPAAANAASHRLRPWLALVVLEEGEFVDGQNIKDNPLPYFELAAGVDATDVFPAQSELWAWAHVHVNKDLSEGGDGSLGAELANLQSTLDANADHACSRILCPRRLKPNVGYHAFLIPVFETGRLAGLGLPIPESTVATQDAWGGGQTTFPYYHRWYFKTGTLGDFEYLVQLLKPKPADKRVGVRDMDVRHPGANLPPINVPNMPPELDGVLRLGGALRVPVEALSVDDQAEVEKYEEWDENPYPHPFETAMAARVNLADDYIQGVPIGVDPDPVVTSPLYGQWHALTRRLLHEADGAPVPNDTNWVHELNLDPRFRVAAGFGTKVLQTGQEEYMNAAWEQIGDVLAANNQLRLAQLAMGASISLYQKHIVALAPEKAFVFTAPVHKRVVAQGLTVHAAVQSSVVPKAVLSAPFRRITRPAAPIMKKLGLTAPAASTLFVSAINDGILLPAPPKTAPPEAIKIDDAVNAMMSGNPTPNQQLVDSIREEDQTPASVDALPYSPDFVISEPGRDVRPSKGDTDSEEATRFKAALRDAYTFTSVEFPSPSKQQIDLLGLTQAVVDALDPRVTIAKRTYQSIQIPPHVLASQVETFAPVMAYPVIDVPMYKPLADLSTELFLPRLDLIPPNSLTLLESNQKFIEAYMAGLNHEMARELLWREYPCDQRGSYFRQFWDVSSAYSSDTPTEAERESLRDIPSIHTWPKGSSLGAHNQREAGGDAAQLVLVVRGELLKRYPTAVIYAQKAKWHENDGTIDASAERELVSLSAAEEESLPESMIRKPLFEAKVDPDIYFIGFDLTAAEAKGGTLATDDPGWFFVIKERPGEPRFGLDEGQGTTPPRLINWNNLAWTHLGTAPGSHIALDQTLAFTPYDAAIDQENKPNTDDAQAAWAPSTNSADLAYILYQVPVLVAVHASRMLP